VDHSDHTDFQALGFYGGEPLLAWSTVRDGIEYFRLRSKGRQIHTTFTTNGTLITQSIARFCADHDVAVIVSLDGPQATHDSCRVFRSSRSGSFSKVLKGIAVLRDAYSSGSSRMAPRINCVVGPETDLEELERFFGPDGPEEVRGLGYKVSYRSTPFAVNPQPSAPVHPSHLRQRARWISALKAGEVDIHPDNPHHFLLNMYNGDFLQFYKRCKCTQEPQLGPMGMCQPGLRKFFVDVDGRILPCERVSETFEIGHVQQGGFSADKCLDILNTICDFFDKRCPSCVFSRVCSGCISSYTDASGQISLEALERHCENSLARSATTILEWTEVLEACPHAFDYLEEISLL